ncbi:glycosyltransferase family 2 protein [Pseudoclavibacter terrae]|uniref:glycosyltransferase family 2 protein n=1 Tax=Pseudoclavibacter terrae TaxID=1530195 RepID=UPI00232CD9C5|nr:glycosyltransferase family 2 protein [Pseudoclavibacter terrae]
MVSIVVPTRGGAQRLPRLFEALARQTDSRWEVVVVIDGDTDDSATVCARAAATDPRVRAEVFPENRGRSEALNAGFRAAVGDIIVRCDDDLVPGADYVSTHFRLHEEARAQGREVGLVGLYQNVYPDTAYAEAYGRPHDAKFREDAYSSAPDKHWKYWAGNVSVSRAASDLVGEYDTAFRAYGYEDVDMGYRLAQAGVAVLLVPELETPHFVAATTTEIRVKRAFYSGSARADFNVKHAMPRRQPASGLWGRAVERSGQRSSLSTLMSRARRVDSVLGRVPGPVGEKLVAFLVEAAAVAGYGNTRALDTNF